MSILKLAKKEEERERDRERRRKKVFVTIIDETSTKPALLLVVEHPVKDPSKDKI